MSTALALQLAADLLKMALIVCGPLLAVVLITGVLVSILQVVTQVQDASLAFVPKLVIFTISLALMAPWMLGQLTNYATELYARLAQLG